MTMTVSVPLYHADRCGTNQASPWSLLPLGLRGDLATWVSPEMARYAVNARPGLGRPS